MSETKQTPGPIYADETAYQAAVIVLNAAYPRPTSGNKLNAAAGALAAFMPIINAAPDLLRSCEALLVLAEAYSPERRAENDVISQARAAIAKAEGKSK